MYVRLVAVLALDGQLAVDHERSRLAVLSLLIPTNIVDSPSFLNLFICCICTDSGTHQLRFCVCS